MRKLINAALMCGFLVYGTSVYAIDYKNLWNVITGIEGTGVFVGGEGSSSTQGIEGTGKGVQSGGHQTLGIEGTGQIGATKGIEGTGKP